MFFRIWVPLYFLMVFALISKVNANDLKDNAREQYQLGLTVLAKPDFKKTDYEQVLLHFEKAKVQAAANKDEEDLHQLSILGLARIYYEMAYALADHDLRRQVLLSRSITEYRSIPRFSARWSQALFEQAWAYTIIEDYDGALGALYSLKDPYFSHYFSPESEVLEAIIYWRNCHWDKAEQALQAFASSYVPLLPVLRNLVQKNLKDEAWYRLLKEPGELPEKIRNFLMHENQKKDGLWVKNNIQRIIREIEEMQMRAQVISLETKTGFAGWFKKESPLLLVENQTSAGYYTADPDYFFWNASTKERWIDELGYYRMAIKSRCYE